MECLYLEDLARDGIVRVAFHDRRHDPDGLSVPADGPDPRL
jgi:hypothetical protein